MMYIIYHHKSWRNAFWGDCKNEKGEITKTCWGKCIDLILFFTAGPALLWQGRTPALSPLPYFRFGIGISHKWKEVPIWPQSFGHNRNGPVLPKAPTDQLGQAMGLTFCINCHVFHRWQLVVFVEGAIHKMDTKPVGGSSAIVNPNTHQQCENHIHKAGQMVCGTFECCPNMHEKKADKNNIKKYFWKHAC